MEIFERGIISCSERDALSWSCNLYKWEDYHYHCKVDGEFVWYQGYEEIFYSGEKYMSAFSMVER